MASAVGSHVTQSSQMTAIMGTLFDTGPLTGSFQYWALPDTNVSRAFVDAWTVEYEVP